MWALLAEPPKTGVGHQWKRVTGPLCRPHVPPLRQTMHRTLAGSPRVHRPPPLHAALAAHGHLASPDARCVLPPAAGPASPVPHHSSAAQHSRVDAPGKLHLPDTGFGYVAGFSGCCVCGVDVRTCRHTEAQGLIRHLRPQLHRTGFPPRFGEPPFGSRRLFDGIAKVIHRVLNLPFNTAVSPTGTLRSGTARRPEGARRHGSPDRRKRSRIPRSRGRCRRRRDRSPWSSNGCRAG